MRSTIVIPSIYFTTIIDILLRNQEAICPIGISSLDDGNRYLVRSVYSIQEDTRPINWRPYMLVTPLSSVEGSNVPKLEFKDAICHLSLGLGNLKGNWQGWIRGAAGELTPVTHLLLPGPGMIDIKSTQFLSNRRE